LKKTITISALSVLLTTVLILGGITIFDKNVYYCESRELVMTCDKLSSTGKTCYNSEVGNKRCLDVWQEVEEDFQAIAKSQPKGLQYSCNQFNCTIINDSL